MKFVGQDVRIAAMVAVFANLIFSLFLIYSDDIGFAVGIIQIMMVISYIGILFFYLRRHAYFCASMIVISGMLIPISEFVNNAVLIHLF